LLNPDPGVAREEAELSRVLLARVPKHDPVTGIAPKRLVLVMLREDPRRAQEAVYILRTASRPTPPEFVVVHATARESIVLGAENAEATFTEAAIDGDAVTALETSLGTMTLGARWPDREGTIARMKWSAVIYTFDYHGDNVHGQGNTVSPEEGTCSAAAVELGELLIAFADAPDEIVRRELRARLLERSGALSRRLK
jgi:hypothetical protein